MVKATGLPRESFCSWPVSDVGAPSVPYDPAVDKHIIERRNWAQWPYGNARPGTGADKAAVTNKEWCARSRFGGRGSTVWRFSVGVIWRLYSGQWLVNNLNRCTGIRKSRHIFHDTGRISRSWWQILKRH